MSERKITINKIAELAEVTPSVVASDVRILRKMLEDESLR